MSHVYIVDRYKFCTACVAARNIFVGGEIVFQTLDDLFGYIRHIAVMSVNDVVTHNGNQFVVGFVGIEQSKPAYRSTLDQQVTVYDVFLCEYTDIHRVAVADNVCASECFVAEFGNLLSRIGLRQKSIQSRNNIRILLRTVYR